MFYLQNNPGRICLINGKEFLFFSGYSYLGMSQLPEFIEMVKKGIDHYGVLFPSSRISNTRLKLFEDFENVLSELTSMESTVTFSSGYLSGQTIAAILSGYKNIFVAPNTHPAIKVKQSLGTEISDFTTWSNEVLKTINNSSDDEFVLISDSINIMQSVVYDFSFLEKIITSKKIIFLIDDSHGVGILGNNGEGIISELPKKENIEYILSYSLSKALNINGGAVSCSKYFADLLRHHSNYTASTSINPSLVFAFNNSQHLYSDQRKKLRQNISLTNHMGENLFHKNKSGLPILISKKPVKEALMKNDIIISSFGYPTPQSKSIDRAIINALHTTADVEKLLNTTD